MPVKPLVIRSLTVTIYRKNSNKLCWPECLPEKRFVKILGHIKSTLDNFKPDCV